MRRALPLVLAILLSAVEAPKAQGVLIDRRCVTPLPRPMEPVGMICRPDAGIVRTRTDVRVRLTDRVLRYEVEETFVNRGGRVGEADYVFPLPKNAAFQDLQLEIDGELVAGETYGADEARRMYEEIVRRQRDPALVEWMGMGMLRTRIFPINPGETKRVVVRFQSVATREGDALRVDYFGGTRADQRSTTDNSPVNLVLEYPDREGYGRAYSPTHSVDVSDRGSRFEARVRGDARDATILIPVARANAAAISVLTNAPGREDGFAMVTITPPDRGNTAATPRDITLVLDVSGSMQGQKMSQARAAGHQLLQTLRPDDRFRLIDFSTDVHTFRDDFVFATPENLRAARRYLDDLDATGSTNIEAALREAMRIEPTRERLPLVLFVTDGAPTVGERDPLRLADLARRDARGLRPRVFSFGVGADVNVTLLEQLAIEGRGTSQFVRPEESVERSVALVAARLVDPVLTEVRVRASGNISLNRMLPASGADVFAGQDLVVFARYRGDGNGTVTVEGIQNGRSVQWTTNVSFPERANENPFVARLWAAQRIGFLSAERRRNGGTSELDREIRELGERFGIPTEFTSYFVKEPAMTNASMGVGAVGGTARMTAARTQGGGGGGGRGGAAPPAVAAGAVQFEAARQAADQRAMKSVAVLDSARRRDDASERRVEGRTFHLKEGVWTDARPAGSTREVTVKAYSAAYFELLKQIPELAKLAGVGEQITVVGRGVVISIRSATGVETLSATELNRITSDW
jgi:Ca-activated chloride channel family protein